MTKPTIFLVAVALAVVLEVGLSGTIGHYKNWDQFSGNHIGFAAGKCSALSGLLPEPKSGCCGKHAGADEDNGGSEDSSTDDGNNGDGNGNNESDDSDHAIDDGSNGIDDGDNDMNDDNGDEDNDYGNGNDWVGGIGDIFEGVGSIYDDVNSIFDALGIDGFNSQLTGFNAKENSSDIAPGGYITAGKKAGIRQYPWLVHLNIKVREMMRSGIVGCGGSLISSRFVLTAAHCVAVPYQSLNDINIFLAEYNTNTFPTDCVGKTCIKNVVMHPEKVIKHSGFEPNMLSNDIALMRLRGSAPYTEFIRPICLPPFNIDVPKNHGTPLSIAGWGSTGRAPSPIKLTAQVKLVARQQCQRSYGDLTSSHICAASNNGQDTCQGDSGGPIMAERDGTYYIVGIVSGKSAETSCGSSVPTLYTNVYAFRKWIHNNMRV